MKLEIRGLKLRICENKEPKLYLNLNVLKKLRLNFFGLGQVS